MVASGREQGRHLLAGPAGSRCWCRQPCLERLSFGRASANPNGVGVVPLTLRERTSRGYELGNTLSPFRRIRRAAKTVGPANPDVAANDAP